MERFAAGDFLALARQHIPEPRLHQVRYYGHYANAARARRAARQHAAERESVAAPGASGRAISPIAPAAQVTETDETAQRRRSRRLWAQLLRRVYEVDPLTCRRCGEPMRIVAFIQEPATAHSLAALGAAAPPRQWRLQVPIRKILAHLERQGEYRHPSRDPPVGSTTSAAAS